MITLALDEVSSKSILKDKKVQVSVVETLNRDTVFNDKVRFHVFVEKSW